jgi:serine protease AprX
MRKLLCILLVYFSFQAIGQTSNYYWIFFKDKPGSSAELISKEQSKYIKKLSSQNVKVIGISKWFNAAFVHVENPQKLGLLKKLTFIQHIEASGKYKTERTSIYSGPLNYGQADVQINMLGLNNYHTLGFTGKGVTLALFDAGFYKVDSINAFDSLRKRNGILATRDFASNNSLVYDDHEHGMYVLSLIAGYIKDSLNGAAPDVNLLLARTEVASSEKHMEEFNWVRALEWADSIGVDIIHSSLGYSRFDSLEGNYTYNDMDGKSTIITRAAQEAFKRGIFITNSAGNEGKNDWKYITAPCDGKDVLCVGSVDSFQRKSNFSSFGPSADGRVKPDVLAMGQNVSIIGMNGIMRRGSGTSFSGPIIAGFVACLKQNYPGVSNSILLDAIRKSGHLYLTPTDSMGYGIPNIQRADSLIKKTLSLPSNDKNLRLTVFPNPCTTTLFIEGYTKFISATLMDMHGKILHSKIENHTIDMSQFKPGVYILNIETGEGKMQRIKVFKI